MAEVVKVLVAAFLGALIGGFFTAFASRDVLTRIESCLKEVKTALESLMLEKKNLSPPEHPLEASNVVHFTQNKLIRDWWIGGGKKKAKEE